jgi:hypothetical protein
LGLTGFVIGDLWLGGGVVYYTWFIANSNTRDSTISQLLVFLNFCLTPSGLLSLTLPIILILISTIILLVSIHFSAND